MYFTGYRDPEVWADLGLIGESLSFTTDDTVTKLGIGYIRDCDVECAMDTAVRFTLLNAGENGEINAKQMLNQHTRLAALIERGLAADGWYLDDEEKKQRGWVFHENGIRLHWNRISSYYSHDDAHFSAGHLGATELWQYDRGWSGRSWMLTSHGEESRRDYKKLWESEDGFYPIPLRGNERMAMNMLEDKEVLKCINQSLNRMVKSGKAIQVTAGRGRTFRWNKWGWLDEYRQKHLVTMAKQRKLGDVVNGWEFTKGHVTNKYGVEICDHEWHPVSPVKYFSVIQKVPTIEQDRYGWYNHDKNRWEQSTELRWHRTQLPYFFMDETEAQAVVDELNSHSYPRKGIGIRRNGELLAPLHELTENEVKMRVRGEVMIEDYMHPDEMFKRIQLSAPDIAKELNALLKYEIDKEYGNITQKEE
tara:strand:+ start:1360 stop:2619 length:1260 start_codon:yes stop_codon:yes gene_type:complete